MRKVSRTTQFKKDVKRIQKRGKRFDTFKSIIIQLAKGEKLSERFRDHALVGEYKGSRECHIEPDWLLIYELTDDEIVLVRTGSHADLFK
ncbi:MAG TPA: type II toxin-antitoxin system YafQ family toxin [Chloroflexi bacterium]|nr:type II toxin-antitoxin system YafQ family toxin [Chloroflexota bacterium]